MTSSSGSESPILFQSLETKLRSGFLHHFGITNETQNSPIEFDFSRHDTRLDVEFYGIRVKPRTSRECCCAIFPTGTTELEIQKHLHIAQQAFDVTPANVPSPIEWGRIAGDRLFILYRSQMCQNVEASTNAIFEALQRLHNLSIAPRSHGYGTNPTEGQTWQEWFTDRITVTLQDMSKIDGLDVLPQIDVIINLTNSLLGSMDLNSAGPGLVHENLSLHNVRRKIYEDGEPFFLDTMYFYGPAEWILTTWTDKEVDLGVFPDSVLAIPRRLAKHRLKLYTVYKRMRSIGLQHRPTQSDLELVNMNLGDLVDIAHLLETT